VLLDGWCQSVVFSQVLDCYSRFSVVQSEPLMKVTPYREFIGWLMRQELKQGGKLLAKQTTRNQRPDFRSSLRGGEPARHKCAGTERGCRRN